MRKMIVNTKWINQIPLILVYVFYPIINISSRLAGYDLPNNWIDGAWGLLFLLIVLLIFVGKRKRFTFKWFVFVITYVIFIWVCLRLLVNLINNQIEITPLLMELKPFFYLIFAWLWIKKWGIPNEDSFIRGGAWLGTTLMADFAIESSLAGQMVRIRGSGEINYDAALLVLSICFLIANKKLIQKKHILETVLIFLGLFASLSRTGLITAVLLLVIFGQLNFFIKVSIVSAAFFTVLESFWVRNLSFTLETIDRYWMWNTGITLFINHPIEFLFGFGVQPLPVIIPPQLAYLWLNIQQAGWGLSGIYAYSFHAFWLRFITSWGIVTTIPLFYFLGSLLFKQRSPILLRILSLLFIMEGFTMGVIYLSNVGIPLIIAILTGLMSSNSKILVRPVNDNVRLRLKPKYQTTKGTK